MKYVRTASVILILGSLAAQDSDRGSLPGVPIVVRYDAKSIYLSNGLVDALFSPKFCRRVFEKAFDDDTGAEDLRLRMLSIDGQDRQPAGVFVGRLAISGSPDLEQKERLFKAAIRELEVALSKRLSGPRLQSADRVSAQLEEELRETEARLAELADRHAQVRDLQRSLEHAEEAHAERQRLEVEMAARDAEQALLMKRLAAYEAERAEVQGHCQKMADELDARSAQLRDIEAKLSGNMLPEKRAELRVLHSQTERVLDTARAALESQRARAETMGDRLAQASEAMRGAAARVEALRARGKALESAANARASMTESMVAAERIEQDLRLCEERRGRLAKQLDDVRSMRRSGVRVRVQRW